MLFAMFIMSRWFYDCEICAYEVQENLLITLIIVSLPA